MNVYTHKKCCSPCKCPSQAWMVSLRSHRWEAQAGGLHPTNTAKLFLKNQKPRQQSKKNWGLLTHMWSFPSSPADKAVAGPFMESQRTGVIGDPDVNGEHWDPEPRISRSVDLLRNFWKFLTAVLNTNISCLCFFGNATLIRVMWGQFTQGVITSFL